MIVSLQEDERLDWREHAHVANQFSLRMTYRMEMRDMGRYIISIICVGSITSHPPGS